MAIEAPSSFNQHIFFEANSVFYGTDDGYQDGSFTEFSLFQSFFDSLDSRRQENIHLVSAVGGLYGLNLIPLWRPRAITFFDINPHATAYFEVIRKVFAASSSKQDFLARLSHQDYDVEIPADKLIRENLALKMRGQLSRSKASNYKRTLEVSWQYALNHFDLTKGLLADVPLQVLTESIEGERFGQFVRNEKNVWLFCSNIVEFVFSGLRFDHPDNAVMVSMIYPGQVELLDLSPFGNRPTEVRFEIPLAASAIGEQLIPAERASTVADQKGIQLATICRDQLKLQPTGRILDVGCDRGRLAIALDTYLDEQGEYEGFDPQREHVFWAQANVMPKHKSCAFHVANIHNRIYNPTGSLRPCQFRFPYSNDRFNVVVACALFSYLSPEAFEHYVAEMARVLNSGGGFLATFFLLNEQTQQIIPTTVEAPCFRYRSDEVTTTGPNRGGRAAYEEQYVQNVLDKNGIELEHVIHGAWRGHANGHIQEDIILGWKR